MKKFLSLAFAFCLSFSLCVNAFAISDKSAMLKSEIDNIYGTNYSENIALYPKVYTSNGSELKDEVIPSGTVLYYPIVVPNESGTPGGDVDWYFATSSHDVRNINVRINKSVNSSLIEGASIVTKKLNALKYQDNSPCTQGVKCVEVRLNPYYGSKTEQEVAFSIQFREGSSAVFDSYDYDKGPLTEVFVGKEAESPVAENDPSSATGYSGRIRGGNLNFRINENTRVVRLDEFDGQEVKSVSISGGNLDFSYETETINQNPLFLEVTNKPDPKIADKYYNFDLEFLSFPGKPMFDRLGTLSIGVSEVGDKYYVYQIEDGNLKKIDSRFDTDSNCIVIKTRVLGDYVISHNKELSSVAETVIPDDPSENITVGASGEDLSSGAQVGSKPNFNSGDNSVLPAMTALGIASGAVVVGLVYYKKKNK